MLMIVCWRILLKLWKGLRAIRKGRREVSDRRVVGKMTCPLIELPFSSNTALCNPSQRLPACFGPPLTGLLWGISIQGWTPDARDRFAIEEWIESRKCVHNCRDHANHIRTMNGDMWGTKKGCIDDMTGKAEKFPKHKYMQNIYLLEEITIWPMIKHDQMSHNT